VPVPEAAAVTGKGPHFLRTGTTVDPLVRRERFEAAYPYVTILSPATLNSRWLAVFPPGSDHGDLMRTTAGGWQLEDLMDQLEAIFPPEDS
jgi:hypothetical protein